MPDQAALARQIARQGAEVLLRLAPATQGGAWRDVPVIAHVIDARATDLAPGAGVMQAERHVRIAQAEIDLREVPRTLTQGDRIVLPDGTSTTVTEKAEIRYARGLPVLHVIRVKGG
jgi:hypothetical protein